VQSSQIAIGLGCGFLGYGSGEWIRGKIMKEQPDVVKRIEIEKQDERNLAIGYRSKAKAYDLMVYIFGALLLVFTLLDVQLAAILLLASFISLLSLMESTNGKNTKRKCREWTSLDPFVFVLS
jgi:hypothetical protein